MKRAEKTVYRLKNKFNKHCKVIYFIESSYCSHFNSIYYRISYNDKNKKL